MGFLLPGNVSDASALGPACALTKSRGLQFLLQAHTECTVSAKYLNFLCRGDGVLHAKC